MEGLFIFSSPHNHQLWGEDSRSVQDENFRKYKEWQDECLPYLAPVDRCRDLSSSSPPRWPLTRSNAEPNSVNKIDESDKKSNDDQEYKTPGNKVSPVGFLGSGLCMGLMSCPSCVFLGLPWDAAGPVGAVEGAGCKSPEAGAGALEVRSEVMADSGLKDAGPSTSATSSLFDSGVSRTALG
ncbi:hypothetical protein E2C01_014310 [Portunus trituberculatus]|uniref:Uncharacterized protein n=1 Tax=Portunus trituberculatus TaxID=210409 RepID=A0A5B7DK41_PORTR|nr:hypothetical protein [Portunus trituberculatus]